MNLSRICNPLNKIKQRLMPAESLRCSANGNFNKVHNMHAPAADGNLPKEQPFSLIDYSFPKITGMTSPLTSCQILGPGIILWKNYISFRGQVEIVNICQKYGARPRPRGFYIPHYPRGVNPALQIMCFGRFWDPHTKYDHESSEVARIPKKLISLVEGIIKDSQSHLNSEDDEALPSMSPDVCIVNFNSICGRLGFRQDCDESSSSLKRGLPVVSITIGNRAEFIYRHTNDESKAESVSMESGDALIFGGKSRHIYHDLKGVEPDMIPKPLYENALLKDGILNLTFKKF